MDHPSIRRHKWDHTTLGFLYRAAFGSLRDWIGGRLTARDLFANWAAVLKLPFVHLGLADDFWRGFADRYMELERGLRSTYFVIPFADRPGSSSNSPAPDFRAARYGARDIADIVNKLLAAGCEVWITARLTPGTITRRDVRNWREIRGFTGAGGDRCADALALL